MDWIKRNKLVTLLLIIVLLLIVREFLPRYFQVSRQVSMVEPMYEGMEDVAYTQSATGSKLGIAPVPAREAPPVQQEERLVVEESSMSMVVNNVRETSDKIIDHAKSVGGYMVNTSLANPEEAPFATVTIRVPSDNLRSALDYFRSLTVKVTSENIRGTDVTDEYVDIEARLATLEKTKAKFEEILAGATQVQDILEVQRQLIYIQDQIDALKGRQKYLEQTAALAKITAYISTDEFALPYAPTERFRPNVIFKLAVRSLVTTLRGLAKTLIWVGVYAIIWIPLGLITFFAWKFWQKRSTASRKL